MSEGKTRLGRFDKWGYKNNFSKGELARELVYTNEENDNLKQALNEIRELIKKNMYYYDDGEEQGCDCDVDGLKIWEIIDKVDLGDK